MNEKEKIKEDPSIMEKTPKKEKSGFKAFIIKRSPEIHYTTRVVLIFMIVLTFFISWNMVPSESMESTLMTGSFTISSRVAYWGDKQPQRGDVFVFHYPDDEHQLFVKRCMGVPGDLIEIKDAELYVNKELVVEDFLNEKYEGNWGPYYVPEKGDTIYVSIKDGIPFCYDNGYFVGYQDFLDTYCSPNDNGTYTVLDDCYFALGDNCNVSLDSRFWKNMYVTDSNVTGRLDFTLYHGIKKVKNPYNEK